MRNLKTCTASMHLMAHRGSTMLVGAELHAESTVWHAPLLHMQAFGVEYRHQWIPEGGFHT